jgi:hypothetical protein
MPEDGILHSHRRENLKSYMFNYVMHLQFLQIIIIVKVL